VTAGPSFSKSPPADIFREGARSTSILERLAGRFRDYRNEDRIELRVGSLSRQRVCGIALGYEDLNDHDSLRHDVVMGLLSEKHDPCGEDRVREQDRGKAIAGKSTLNRLELTPEDANEKSRYKKIVADQRAIDELMVTVFIESYENAPSEVMLDVDATDNPLHGNQEGGIFTGITPSIAICRCISSVASTCYMRGYARPMRSRPAECSKSWCG